MAQVQVEDQSGSVNNGAGGGDNQLVPTSLYVGDLDPSVTESQLYDYFVQIGSVLTVRVCKDLSTRGSLGYGYVNYGNPQDAALALDLLNFTPLNGKPIRIMYSNRDHSIRKSGAGNVFIKNLDKGIDHKALHDTFSAFGNILSCKLATDSSGQSKDAAARAVESLNGKKFDDKEWYVGKAQKKSEREVDLKLRFEQSMKEAADKVQGANLYVKNLDDSISDEKLKELFSQYGAITSCKVMRDPNGVSKGSGFVAFSTPEEASNALAEMNGKMVVSKPLYVALAQKKEDRRARLQAQFSQMRPVAMTPSAAPRMPMYPPGGTGLGQQTFYGQGPPTMFHQPGFGYQQQLVPGMRPGGAPMPNFFVPMVQQGQQGQRPGGRRSGAVQQSQRPASLMQQQVLPRGRVYRRPPGRGLPDVSMPKVAGGKPSVPYDMGGMPMHGAPPQPFQIGALASALAHATPNQRRTVLGECLYPRIEQLEPDTAAKVTGMLLEMDQTEILHLLESPEALKAKVAEAMEVLSTVAQQQQTGGGAAADQLASLSLSDDLVS
ncbi:hypothetical protein V6N13_089817 [Hibiscus sabdariffa]|uniref:Polyadenylate-binding protein n=1 Tax=Hibiscus sabdariffa TaxID=183260 RepID=A0ABR2QIP5_9ROSI